MESLNKNRADAVVIKTVLLLCAVAINALEFFIPRVPFFPWLKPGFANIITIIWIIEFGAVDAVLFSLLRVWIVGFFFGFSFLTMALALSGGVLSTVAMGILWTVLGKRGMIGTLGLAMCGALCHNFGQLLAVYGLMAANMHLFYQVPLMCAASVVFGGIVGLCAPVCRNAIFECEKNHRSPIPRQPLPAAASFSDFAFSLALFAGCAAIVFTESGFVLAACACGATLIVQVARKGSRAAFFAPLTSFWLLFVFVACVNLFFSYGTRIERFPLFTHEGVDLTVLQWLRLWTWLQLSFVFSYFNFHAVMLSMLQRLFPRHRSTLFAGVLGLEYFPAIASESRAYAKKTIRSFFSYPLKNIITASDGQSTAQKTGLSGLITRWTDALYRIVIRRMESGV
jgi:heptaprenyl diphosphate synthase